MPPTFQRKILVPAVVLSEIVKLYAMDAIRPENSGHIRNSGVLSEIRSTVRDFAQISGIFVIKQQKKKLTKNCKIRIK